MPRARRPLKARVSAVGARWDQRRAMGLRGAGLGRFSMNAVPSWAATAPGAEHGRDRMAVGDAAGRDQIDRVLVRDQPQQGEQPDVLGLMPGTVTEGPAMPAALGTLHDERVRPRRDRLARLRRGR